MNSELYVRMFQYNGDGLSLEGFMTVTKNTVVRQGDF